MKFKSAKFSIVITLFMTVLIISIGYKVLAFAGASFLDKENGIEHLPTGNSTSYVFYSQSEDNITLYPWTYYNDAVPIQNYFGHDSYIIDTINQKLYGTLTYYFYRMISKDLWDFLYNDVDNMYIRLAERIKFDNVEDDLKIIILPNNEFIYCYSKDFPIDDETYNLSVSFKLMFDYEKQEDYIHVISFQTKQITDETPSKEYINNSKEYLSNYINTNPYSIDEMCVDIINRGAVYAFYSLTDNNESTESSLNITESESITITEAEINALNEKFKNSTDSSNYDYEEKILHGKTSYQLVYTNNEFLIICLENNLVLHYDPDIYAITGFNLLETYGAQTKY